MKLIAENSFDDQLIPGLVSLLRDLRVDACGFRTEQAIAPIFWSAEDFLLDLSSVKSLSKQDVTMILSSLESDLTEAMILAGYEVIQNYLNGANGTLICPKIREAQ